MLRRASWAAWLALHGPALGADGLVFPGNPVTSELVLETLPVDGELLRTERVDVWSCPALEAAPGPFGRRVCPERERIAGPDPAGDFLFEPADGSPRDPFAEVSALWHAHGALALVDEAPEVPVTVLTGGSYPGAFVGDVDGDGRADLVLGVTPEGLSAAYDGDVIAHEAGHVVTRAALDGLGPVATTRGVSWTSRAIDEGLADALGALWTDDPRIGEYLAIAFDELWLRDVSTPLGCDDRTGDPFLDGRLVAGVIWGWREAYGREVAAAAWRDTVRGLPSRPGWADVAAALRGAAPDAAVVPGLEACGDDLAWREGTPVVLHAARLVAGPGRSGSALQVRVPVDGAAGLHVEVTGWTGPSDLRPAVYVRGGAPVGFDLAPDPTTGAVEATPVVYDAGGVAVGPGAVRWEAPLRSRARAAWVAVAAEGEGPGEGLVTLEITVDPGDGPGARGCAHGGAGAGLAALAWAGLLTAARGGRRDEPRRLSRRARPPGRRAPSDRRSSDARP